MFGVARRGYGEAAFARGAVQSSADICLCVRQGGKRNFERGAGFQFIDVTQELLNDLFVFSFAACGNFVLANCMKPKLRGIGIMVAFHGFAPLVRSDAGEWRVYACA